MRRTKEEAEHTRDDILKSAVQIFSEKGVARATLEEIAKGAGVTRGAIYWHFENKAQIFDALHELMHRPFLSGILEGLEKEHTDTIEQLQELWIKLFFDLEHDEQRKQALILFLKRCNYTGELAQYKAEHQKKEKDSIRAFQDYFEKAIASKKLPSSINTETLTEGMFCYMKGILYEYLDNHETYNIRKKAPELVSLFFSLLSQKNN